MMTKVEIEPTLLGQDHVVLVVADLESAIENWRDQFGLPLQYEVTHEEHGLSQAFFPLADGTFMELIAPTNDQSRVAEILREKGEGIHVLAMQVDDLDTSVKSLQEKGVELIGVGTDRVFIHPDSANGVMIQLWPKDRPHRWRDGINDS